MEESFVQIFEGGMQVAYRRPRCAARTRSRTYVKSAEWCDLVVSYHMRSVVMYRIKNSDYGSFRKSNFQVNSEKVARELISVDEARS